MKMGGRALRRAKNTVMRATARMYRGWGAKRLAVRGSLILKKVARRKSVAVLERLGLMAKPMIRLSVMASTIMMPARINE